MSTPPSSNTATPYKRVYVAQFCWSSEMEDRGQRWYLENPLKDLYSFHTTNIDELIVGLSADMTRAQATDVFINWLFNTWLAGKLPTDGNVDYQDDVLLIITYMGHGDTRDSLESDGEGSESWTKKHLLAVVGAPDNTEIAIDLTKVQEAFRDNVNADVLFIVECCDGAWEGWGDLPPNHMLEHRVETISAGMGNIGGNSWKYRDFIIALIDNLRSDEGPTSARDRSNALRRQAEKAKTLKRARPTWTSMYEGRGDIMLHHLSEPMEEEQEMEDEEWMTEEQKNTGK